MQSPQERHWKTQYEKIRKRIKNSKGNQFCVEIHTTALDLGVPNRANRHTLKDDHKTARERITKDKDGNSPEYDSESLTREDTVVEE